MNPYDMLPYGLDDDFYYTPYGGSYGWGYGQPLSSKMLHVEAHCTYCGRYYFQVGDRTSCDGCGAPFTKESRT